MSGGSVHHFLSQIEWPEKEIRTVTDVIIYRRTMFNQMVPDALHSDNTICKLDLKTNQRAFIIKVQVLYTHNETDDPIVADIGPMFHVDHMPENPEECHPDKTGVTRFMIPGKRWTGVVHPDARVLYEPNLVNVGINILQYAGIENAILEARSTVISPTGVVSGGYRAFTTTDPLLMFYLTHKQHFEELHANDIRQQTQTVYVVRQELVQRIQDFFRDTVYPHLLYTTARALPLKCNFEHMPETVMVMISTDYMVISPQKPVYKTSDVRLKI
jgi:hypothetical protein